MRQKTVWRRARNQLSLDIFKGNCFFTLLQRPLTHSESASELGEYSKGASLQVLKVTSVRCQVFAVIDNCFEEQIKRRYHDKLYRTLKTIEYVAQFFNYSILDTTTFSYLLFGQIAASLSNWPCGVINVYFTKRDNAY